MRNNSQSQNYTDNKAIISIIIPVYNVEAYLRECLDSVVNQTYKNLEIICINDGSTDNSLDILKEYAEKDNRIVIINQENQGVAQARNVGINHATGTYIGFVDSDDWIDLDFYEKLYLVAQKKNADLVRSCTINHFCNDKIKSDNFNNILLKKKTSFLNINDHKAVIWDAIYKTSIIKENNILFVPQQLHEDILWATKATYYAKHAYPCCETFYHYRRAESDTQSSNIDSIAQVNCETLNFINSVQYPSKTDYIEAIRKCFWRYANYFDKNHTNPKFSNKGRIEFLKLWAKDWANLKEKDIIYQKTKPLALSKEEWLHLPEEELFNKLSEIYLNPQIKSLKEYFDQNPTKSRSNDIILVKNVEGYSDTTAKILIQNKINFEPKVSVIIPVYNAEEYLKSCLESILNQSLKEIEIICVDDGSTDSSIEILKEYASKDNRITILKQQNHFAGVARNAALAVAKGEYLSFIDSDDFFELNMLEEMIKKADKDKSDVVICEANFIQVNTDKPGFKLINKNILKNRETFSCKEPDIAKKIFQMICAVPWNKIYKREIINKNNIRFSACHHHNDTAFVMAAIIAAQNISYLDKKLTNYRIIDSSLCHKKTSHPDSIHKCLMDIYTLTKKLDNYAAIQQSYFAQILNMAEFYHNEAPESLKDEIKDYLLDIFKKFELNKYPINYFYEKNRITWLKELLPIKTIIQNKFDFEPKVSVIVPVYNVEKYLHECLNSIIHQTLKEIEIICIDDGSTDNSLEILKEYALQDNRISVITKINKGLSHTRNIGIKLAKGKYIGFVDSDDWINEEFYEELYKIAKNTKADICSGNILKTDNKNEEYYSHFTSIEEANSLEEKFKLYTIPLYCYVHNKIYLKDKIIQNNLFFIEGIYFEDMFWTPVVLKTLGKCVTSPNSTYYYRINPNSISNNIKFGTPQRRDFFNGQRFTEDFIEEHKLPAKTFKAKENIIIPILNKNYLSDYQACIDSIIKHKPYDVFYQINILSNEELNQTFKQTFQKFEELYRCRFNIINYKKGTKLKIGQNYEHHFYLKKPVILSKDITNYLSNNIVPLSEKVLDKDILYLLKKYHINLINQIIPYLLFPVYLIKTIRMQKKIHKKVCQIIRGQLAEIFDNTLLITKQEIRDFALKNSPAPDYTRKYIKKIANDIYDKFHFRKKYRILGIKFYKKNKHKELTSLLNYSIKQNELIKKELQQNKNDIVNLRNYLNQQTNIIQERLLSVTDYKKALEIWYRSKTGKVLNLDNPQTFNEKIQWLKLYDSTPLKTQLADKYRVREWVKEKIGEEYLIPLLGVYDSFDEIDFDKLPTQFVIKCNHGCGYNIIVKDKSTLNIQDAKNKINSWMKEDFAFKNGYELHYHGIQPKIIIEEFIDPYISNHEIQAWIFNNEIKFISVETIKDGTNLERSTFYLDGKETEFQISPIYYKKLKSNISPHIFNKAIDIAKKLKFSIPYVRIDLIEYNGDIKFREFTFTSGSGLSQIYPSNYSKTLGDWLILPSKIYNISTKEYSKV